VALAEGRDADALDHYRSIRYARSARARRSTVLNCATEVGLFEEIVTLTRLAGKSGGAYLDEAKALLARAPAPKGDYLVLARDVARLAVSFAARDPGLVADDDVRAMMRYERLASGWSVLALVGWHAHARGDRTLASRAIRAEQSKPRAVLAVAIPSLAEWLDSEAYDHEVAPAGRA
jgi:hypothetical protein